MVMVIYFSGTEQERLGNYETIKHLITRSD